jgi:hypothetical protein
MTNTPYAGGAGTAANPYLICTAAQLNNIGLRSQDWGANFLLLNNINLSAFSGMQFNIIGSHLTAQPFTGVFNGNNLTISNFSYTNSSIFLGIGLFGYIGGSAVIENLNLANAVVNGGTGIGVGVLIGEDDGLGLDSLINISVIDSVVSTATNAGGIAGVFRGSMKQVTFSGSVTSGSAAGGIIAGGGINPAWSGVSSSGTVTGTLNVGGIAGQLAGGTLTDSFSTATVSENTSGYTGGLVGQFLGGTISNSYYIGSISGTSYVGGLVGNLSGATITSSYSSGTVMGTVQEVGGLVGWSTSNSSISTSFSLGSVSGPTLVGGLAGLIDATAAGFGVYNSYSHASATTSGIVSGGLIGKIVGGNNPDVQYSYASGLVSGGGTQGGITGRDGGTGVYVSCFFDSTINPALNGISAGINTVQNVNAVGEPTSLMQTSTTYSAWPTSIWDLLNGSYPMLLR